MTGYRETPKEGYSLDELSAEAMTTCGLLAWELRCRDRRAPPEEIEELFAAADVSETFQQRLSAVIQSFDLATADKDRERWEGIVNDHIDGLTEPREREVIFSFLFDLAAIATINPAEDALLDRLRQAWDLLDR